MMQTTQSMNGMSSFRTRIEIVDRAYAYVARDFQVSICFSEEISPFFKSPEFLRRIWKSKNEFSRVHERTI